MSAELRAFVVHVLESHDCLYRPIEHSLFRVSLDSVPALSTVFECSDVVHVACAEFEEDVLAGLENVRSVTFGSYYLHRLIEYVCERGVIGDVEVPEMSPSESPSDMLASISEQVSVSDNTSAQFIGVEMRKCVSFHFVVDLKAVEQCRSLHPVTVECETGCLIDPWCDPLLVTPIDRIAVPAQQIEQGYEVALSTLGEKVRQEMVDYDVRHAQELKYATGELEAAQERDMDDWHREASRLRGRGASDDEIERRNRDRLREWRLRLAQIRRSYVAEEARIRLVAVSRELRPFHRYLVTSPQGGARDAEFHAYSDAYHSRTLSSLCRNCGKRASELQIGDAPCSHLTCDHCHLGSDCGHVVCQGCSAKCVDCNEADQCIACGISCRGCNGYVCASCDEELPCGHCACRNCRIECAECGIISCTACSASCSDCSASLCSTHDGRCSPCSELVLGSIVSMLSHSSEALPRALRSVDQLLAGQINNSTWRVAGQVASVAKGQRG